MKKCNRPSEFVLDFCSALHFPRGAALVLGALLLWPAFLAAETEPNNTLETANPVAMSGDGRIADLRVGSEVGDRADASEDWFGFNAEAGDRLSLTVYSTSGNLNPQVNLVDPDGLEITYDYDDGPGNSARLYDVLLAKSGTHYARVLGSGTGTYEVTAWVFSSARGETDENGNNDTRGNADPLTAQGTGVPGQAVFTPRIGNVDTGDTDWYQVYLHPAEELTVTVTAGASGTLVPTVVLTDGLGVEITSASDDDLDGVVVLDAVALAAEGLHFISVNGTGDGWSAPYLLETRAEGRRYSGEIEPNNAFAQATAIAQELDGAVLGLVVGMADGERGLNGDATDDWFSFETAPGDRVTVTVHTTSGSLNPQLSLVDPDGVEIAYDYDDGPGNSARLFDILVSKPGSHYARVLGSGAGTYEVEVWSFAPGRMETDENNHNDTRSNADTLAGQGTELPGQAVYTPRVGNVDAADVDWYQIYLHETDSFFATVTAGASGTLVPTLLLVDGLGVELGGDDNADQDGVASLESTAIPEDGVYFLQVSGTGAGWVAPYLLETRAEGLTLTGEIEPNDTWPQATVIAQEEDQRIAGLVAGAAHGERGLAGDTSEDWYSFECVEGAHVLITVYTTSGTLNPQVSFHGPGGGEIAYDYDDGPGNSARLYDTRATVTGTHYARVLGSGTGTYEVRVLSYGAGRTETDENGANDTRDNGDPLVGQGMGAGEAVFTPCIGSLDVGEVDWYVVHLQRADLLHVAVTAASSGRLIPALSLQDDLGVEIGSAGDLDLDGVATLAPVTIQTDGLYFIRVSGTEDGWSAGYHLATHVEGRSTTTEQEPNDTQELATPIDQREDERIDGFWVGTATGDRGSRGDLTEDWYSFVGARADRVIVTVHATSGNFNPQVSLHGPGGGEISYDYDDGPGNAARLHNVALAQTGEHFLRVLGSGAGIYEVRVWVYSSGATEADDNGANDAFLAANHNVGVTRLVGGLDEGDQDHFLGHLRAGQLVAIRVTRSALGTLDPAVELLDDQNGRILLDLDGAADGVDAQLAFRAPGDGFFTTRVFAESGAGYAAAYRLTWQVAADAGVLLESEPNDSAASANRLNVGEDAGGEGFLGALVQGRASSANRDDWYRLDVLPGDRFFATLDYSGPGDLTAAFTVHDRNETQVAAAASGMGHNLLAAGVLVNENTPYYVHVRRSAGQGDYDLRVHLGPQGSFTWDGSIYRLTDGALSWVMAQSAARQQMADLVTINSQAENDFLVQAFGTTQNYWLGFNDVETEGTWVWSSGDGGSWDFATGAGDSFTSWHSGEPGDTTEYNAAVINARGVGTWTDKRVQETAVGIMEFFGVVILAPVRDVQIVAGDALYFSGDLGGVPPDLQTTFRWEFGDGRTSTQRAPGLVAFPEVGVHTVTLSSLDPQGAPIGRIDRRVVDVIEAPGDLPDLDVDRLTVPATLEVGVLTTIEYAVVNAGAGPAQGEWSDALYLSDDPVLDGQDLVLASASVVANLAPGGALRQRPGGDRAGPTRGDLPPHPRRG